MFKFIKEVVCYKCEVCRAIYRTEKEAQDCEAQPTEARLLNVRDKFEFTLKVSPINGKTQKFTCGHATHRIFGVVKRVFYDRKGKHQYNYRVWLSSPHFINKSELWTKEDFQEVCALRK